MIFVVGSINMDLIAVLPRLPRGGETVSGGDFQSAPGGKGANQALAARRAGGEVKLVAAVGNDHFAIPSLEMLKAAGVDLSAVVHLDGPTGTALIFVESGGENMIAVMPGANGHLRPDMVLPVLEKARRGDFLLLQLEIPGETVKASLTLARATGMTSILNIAPLKGDVAGLAALADVIVANETEFEHLSGKPTESVDAIAACLAPMHAMTGQSLIVTLGADGVVAAHAGETFHIPAPVIDPVDTVGAGDTFCGFLAQGLESGLDFRSSVARAAVAGALACLKHGAQPAIPEGREVAARL